MHFMINGVTMKILADDYILRALQEDVTSEDVTTNAVMPMPKQGKAQLICKETGIIAGLTIFERVFQLLDSKSEFTGFFQDGNVVKKGDIVGEIKGDIRVLLTGERTALNYLQRMSGIATITNEMAKELQGTKTKLLDTRKTTPNMRPFEKYAVTVGGGYNHRYNLSDGILIKDNHIGAAGSITKAIQMAKEYAPFVRKIEVEVETLAMLDEALEAGADIIMLDNMDIETMKEAVKRTAGRAETECSGNVTKSRLKEIAAIGVDYVSCGALTHSAPILDFSLKNLSPIKYGVIHMEGNARRQELLRLISKSQKPISGTELAQTLHVSRQVIVQDVALLRASKYPIFATNRGYVLLQDDTHHVTRVIRVKHNSHQIEEELNVIVDCGARVLDVTVEREYTVSYEQI